MMKKAFLPEDGWIPQLEQQQMEGPSPELRAAEFIGNARTSFTNFVLSLNNLNVNDALKPHVKSLTDEVNGLLAKLPHLEAHKAATDANYALNTLGSAVGYCQEAFNHVGRVIGEMSKNCTDAMNSKDLAVNGLVESGVKTEVARRVAAGELMEKSIVDGMVQAAQLRGKEVALSGLQTVASRKTKLETLKLPLPEDQVLIEVEDAEFNTLVTNAQTRMTTLAANGLDFKNAPDLCKQLIYSSAFESELKLVTGTLKAAGAKLPGERLLGGGGGNDGKTRMVL